jgi:hypothetical protein
MKVFLSHAEADRKWAEQLRSGLSEAGLEVWNPAHDVIPGSNWHLELGRALERSEAMVVLLSPEAVKSSAVLSEIEYALSASQFRDRLIPVLLRPTEEVPWILRKQNFIRATKDVTETVQRITAALERSPAIAERLVFVAGKAENKGRP